MPYQLVAVGDVGLNLTMLVSWEWNPAARFLVIHMLNDTIYLRDQQAQAMWLLLDTLAALRMGRPGAAGDGPPEQA